MFHGWLVVAYSRGIFYVRRCCRLRRWWWWRVGSSGVSRGDLADFRSFSLGYRSDARGRRVPSPDGVADAYCVAVAYRVAVAHRLAYADYRADAGACAVRLIRRNGACFGRVGFSACWCGGGYFERAVFRECAAFKRNGAAIAHGR